MKFGLVFIKYWDGLLATIENRNDWIRKVGIHENLGVAPMKDKIEGIKKKKWLSWLSFAIFVDIHDVVKIVFS